MIGQLNWDLASGFAQQVMGVIALLAPAPVPRYLLRKIFKLDETKPQDDPLEEVLSQLSQKLSLLDLDQDKDPICPASVLDFVLKQTRDDAQHHKSVITALLNEMNRSYDDADITALKDLEKILPHAHHILTCNHLSLSPKQQIHLSRRIGAFHVESGRHRQALKFMQQALDLAQKHFARDQAEHQDIVTDCNNLGFVLKDLGQYREAAKYFQQALDLAIKTNGEDHPSVASIWNNLGSLYDSQGQNEKAIEYYEKAITSDLKTYGENHPQVAAKLNNLGMTYDSIGLNNEAIRYFKKALTGRLQDNGQEHRSVAIIWNNLGSSYFKIGKYRKARKYFEKALAAFKKSLGDNHPHTKAAQGFLETTLQQLKN